MKGNVHKFIKDVENKIFHDNNNNNNNNNNNIKIRNTVISLLHPIDRSFINNKTNKDLDV